MIKNSWAICILLFLSAAPALGQDIDPRGIYFNRFVGSFNGTEWFQVTPVSGLTYQLRDIFGGGFNGQIDAEGNITIGAFPPGMFTTPDNFVIFPNLGGNPFTFTCNRVPTTTVDFPLTLASAHPANALLAGQWNNTLRSINPETGAMGGPGTEVITITTGANTIRITDPGGLFFQGVFENGLNAGFRVVNNPFFPPPSGIYASFPGSSTNIGQDLLGELNMININQFRASFLLQSRTQLGNQSQTLFEFEAERINPLAQGDANGDGVVNADDEFIVENLQGTTFEDTNYNLAADINSDGIINFIDLAFYCLQGDVNMDGVVNLSDVALFVALVNISFYVCEADINVDGEVNLQDIAPFVEILTGNGG